MVGDGCWWNSYNIHQDIVDEIGSGWEKMDDLVHSATNGGS